MNFEQMLTQLGINAFIYYTLLVVYTVIIVRGISGLINILLWK